MDYNQEDARKLTPVIKKIVSQKHMRYMTIVLKAKTFTIKENPYNIKSRITQAEKEHNVSEVITWMDFKGSIQHELITK